MVFWRIGSVASTLRAMLVRRVIARHWSGKNPFLAEAYPAVQQAVGAANGYGDLVTGPDFWRSIRLEMQRCSRCGMAGAFFSLLVDRWGWANPTYAYR